MRCRMVSVSLVRRFGSMLRFVVRRLPRFGMQALFASLLLFVSVAGAVRYGADPEPQENEALRALNWEGLRYSVSLASGRFYDRVPSEDPWPNPIDQFAKWLVGSSDRIEGIQVSGMPSPETRAKMLALPHVKRIACTSLAEKNPIAAASKSCPTPETVYGHGLPEVEREAPVAAEPPATPEGVPLTDAEREKALREMDVAWKAAGEFPADRFLCRAVVAGSPRTARTTTIAIAVDGDAYWRLVHDNLGRGSNARTETIRRGRAAVCRAWEDDAWRSCVAVRDFEMRLPELDYPLPFSPPTYLGEHHARIFELEPEKLFDSAERLENGMLKLRMRPRGFEPPEHRGPAGKLVEGVIVVDPAHDFALQDLQAEFADPRIDPWKVRYVFDYEDIEGRRVPVRRREWLAPADGAASTSTCSVARYAWDFAPEFPLDLFDLTRDGGEFFTSPPTPRFHWWYVTGAIGLGWFYLLVSRRIRERWRSKKRGQLPPDVAESGEEADDRVGAAAGGS